MFRFAFLALAALLCLTQGAFAQRRVALVVGNNAYSFLGPDRQLKNAVNDAQAVGRTLTGLGFEVLVGENLDRRALIDKLFELASRLKRGDTAFFFFAGHGVSFAGANYLLPSDVPLPRVTGRAEEARLADQAVAETQVMERLSSSGASVVLLVIDACRDNPLQTSDKRSLGATRGLVQNQPPRGVFSLYSAGVGQTALDRLGDDDPVQNSVFTRVLVEKLKQPGLEIRDVAAATREEVVTLVEKVGHEQYPAYYDQIIGGKVYLAGAPGKVEAALSAQPLPPPPPGPDELAWSVLKDIGTAGQVADLLRRFPASPLVPAWRERLAMLGRSGETAAPEPMRAAPVAPPASAGVAASVAAAALAARPVLAPAETVPAPVREIARPSFDCARARTGIEIAICARPELAALDRRVAELFEAANLSANRESAAREQRAWLASRDACAARTASPDALAVCVERAYSQRAAELVALLGSQAAQSVATQMTAQAGLSAAGPSFPCNRARGPIETAICADPELSWLDRELARAFKTAAAGGAPAARSQGTWLATRDGCARGAEALRPCIATAYRRRIEELR